MLWVLKEVDKKYTGCNLKSMELLDCVLIGVCALVGLNMVVTMPFCLKWLVSVFLWVQASDHVICVFRNGSSLLIPILRVLNIK